MQPRVLIGLPPPQILLTNNAAYLWHAPLLSLSLAGLKDFYETVGQNHLLCRQHDSKQTGRPECRQYKFSRPPARRAL
jgi:hypothetical protein